MCLCGGVSVGVAVETAVLVMLADSCKCSRNDCL